MNISLSSVMRYSDSVTNNSAVFSVNLYELQKRAAFSLKVMRTAYHPEANRKLDFTVPAPKYKQVFGRFLLCTVIH
jgi:hypothetical protein